MTRVTHVFILVIFNFFIKAIINRSHTYNMEDGFYNNIEKKNMILM